MKKIVFYLQILAMVFFTMSGVFTGLPAAQALFIPDVLINEFRLDGTQWVELMNTTDSDIDLSASTWQLVSVVMGPGSGTTTLSSGIIPARGLLTFNVSGLPTGASTLLSLNNDGSLIYAMSYGDSSFGAEPHLAGYPSAGQSAVLTGGSSWSATSTITRGWYNEGPAPTIASIVSDINAGGVVTNMGTLSDPSAATGLYFEKRTDIASSTTALGKLTFAGPLNLTNASTTDLLQNLGTEMEAAAGSLSFDARTATDLKDAGATISIYNINDLGYDVGDLTLADLIVKDDDGNVIDPGDLINYPNLSLVSTSTNNEGTFTFTTDHFTSFGFDSSIVYVDAANEGGTEDGTEVNPYGTIQEGIDAVVAGGTVNVASGTYPENININKQLTLIGDIGTNATGTGSDAPTINGTDCTRIVNINTSGVTFRGFIVNGNGGCGYPNIGIAPGLTSTTIANNETLGGYTGISLTSGASGNTITKNKFHNNSEGIFLNGAISNTFSYNEIYDNSNNGIEVVGSKNAGGNNFNHNVINQNGSHGIHLGGYLNTGDGIINIDLNTFNSNGLAGIWIGIYTSDVSITGNTISNNGQNEAATGIHAMSALRNSAHNNIIGNDVSNIGLNNEDANNVFDASNNYWGGANGPYEATSNPGGNASSSVVGKVAFKPYYINEARTILSTVPAVVYVDDDYYDADNDGGHTWGVDAFASIQAGIDAVETGGTVNVAAGNYTENIDIYKKTLSLIGDIGDNTTGTGASAPIITNSNSNRTINVNANNVTVRGLIVENSSSYPAIRIANNITGAVVRNNELRNAYAGVGLATGAHGNTVTKNAMHDNYYGMNIGGAISNTISYNEIYDNTTDGIHLQTGGCNMAGCFSTIGGNSINNNNIYSNGGNGVYFDSNLNTDAGTVNIDSNTIDSNGYAGVYINSGTAGVSIQNNTISNNGQSEALTTGIHVMSASGNSAHNNVISDDAYGVGVNNEDTEAFDATQNYWGTSTGPYEAGVNEAGNINSSIVGNVSYNPWYGDEGMTSLKGITTAGEGDTQIYTVTQEFAAITNGYTLIIPASTTVTGPATWTGEINPPTVTTTSNLPSKAGYTTVMGSIIEVGFGDSKLILSNAAKLVFPGEAGKLVGYTRPGEPFTEITAICGANSQTWADANLGTEGDCKINDGNDLVVWTKHLTTFATYSQTANSSGGGVLLSYQLTLNTQTTTPATYAYPVSPDHNFIKIKGQSAVYWLSPEGKRYLFASRAVFSSWFGNDFSGLREISQAEFDGIASGGNLTVKPGSYIRFDNSDNIYLVKDNYSIYPSTGTAGYVIQAGFESNYNINGLVINRSSIYSQINSSFIKATGQSGVYWLSPENKRYLFANRDVFSSWFGDDFSGLRNISQSEFDGIASGGNLTAKPGSYIRFDNSDNIYLVKDANNICKKIIFATRIYNIQASFEADYNVLSSCQ